MSVRVPHYVRWYNMMRRCYKIDDTDWPNYGGRGIKVCPSWHKFKNFQAWCMASIEPGKTLDRRDNNGEYSPLNCRWASKSEQRRNQRTTAGTTARILKAQKIRVQQIAFVYGDTKSRKDKFCAGCGIFLSLKNFNKNKARHDGLDSVCRNCQSIRHKKRYSMRRDLQCL